MMNEEPFCLQTTFVFFEGCKILGQQNKLKNRKRKKERKYDSIHVIGANMSLFTFFLLWPTIMQYMG